MHMSKYAWILYLHNTFTGKNIRNTQSLLFGWIKPSPCAFLNYLICITSENTCFFNLQATSGSQRTRKHYQHATTSRYLLLSFLHELHLQILPATNSSGFPLRMLAVFIFCWFLKATPIPSSKQAHKITENLYLSLQQSRTTELMEAAPRCTTFAFELAPTYMFSRAWASPSPSRQGCVPVLSSVPPQRKALPAPRPAPPRSSHLQRKLLPKKLPGKAACSCSWSQGGKHKKPTEMTHTGLSN